MYTNRLDVSGILPKSNSTQLRRDLILKFNGFLGAYGWWLWCPYLIGGFLMEWILILAICRKSREKLPKSPTRMQ